MLASHPGPTLAVIGDMLELGEASARYHEALLDSCAGIDQVICVGPEMARLHALLPEKQRGGWFGASDRPLLEAILARVCPGQRVLVKGSNRVFWAADFVAQLCAELAG